MDKTIDLYVKDIEYLTALVECWKHDKELALQVIPKSMLPDFYGLTDKPSTIGTEVIRYLLKEKSYYIKLKELSNLLKLFPNLDRLTIGH